MRGRSLSRLLPMLTPYQGNMGNTPETGAPDADAVTHVTQRPPAMGNTRKYRKALTQQELARLLPMLPMLPIKKSTSHTHWKHP